MKRSFALAVLFGLSCCTSESVDGKHTVDSSTIAEWIKGEQLSLGPGASGLSVFRRELTSSQIQDIAIIPKLAEINFNGCRFPDDGLAGLQSCEFLYSIVIDGGGKGRGITALSSLAEVKPLTALTLSGSFGPLPSDPEVRSAQLRALTKLGSNLKELRFDDYGEVPDEALLAILKEADLHGFAHDSFYYPGVPIEAFGLLMTMPSLKSAEIAFFSEVPEDWPRHERSRIAINLALERELQRRIRLRGKSVPESQ